jgi:hypothetical protein
LAVRQDGGMFSRVNRLLSGIEWRLSLGAAIWGILFPISSFALPAWATRAAGMFSQYAPLSWVLAGFLGVLAYSVSMALYGYGKRQAARAKYDARFMKSSGGVDPLAKVFESKRVFLNDFVLPSHPVIEGKTFVNCEIVGPANLLLQGEYQVNEVRADKVDAVILNPNRYFNNGYIFRNCTFRNCTFHRVTLFFLPEEAKRYGHLIWLNWISAAPAELIESAPEAKLIADQSPQSQPTTATETPQ